jgi:hypothetical protein
MADTLHSDLPTFGSRDSQLSVWLASDLRLRCTARACKDAAIVARPWLGTFLGPERASRTLRFRDIHDKRTLRAQEWYGSVSPLPRLAAKAGSVVAGWGTGILYNPTNRLAAETMFSAQQRQVRGRRMASVIFQGSESVTITVIAGRADHHAWKATHDRQFRMLLTRVDYQSAGRRALNLGVVTGGGRRHATFAGAYGQVLLGDAVTAGFELSASRGYARDGDHRPYRADASLNVRYGLPSGGEIGLEAVFNGFGAAPHQITPSMMAARLAALTAGDVPLHPLTERRYFTLHARLPKLPPAQRVTVTSSLTMTSGQSAALWFGELSYARDHWRLFGATSLVLGADNSTLRVPFSRTSRVGIQISK